MKVDSKLILKLLSAIKWEWGVYTHYYWADSWTFQS